MRPNGKDNVVDARRAFTERPRLEHLAAVRERVQAGGTATWEDMQMALEQARHEFGDDGESLTLAERALQLLGGRA